MRRGAWHQCGDRSQKLAEEQLQHGAGVGVIISPRDLSRAKALAYAERYRALGAEVLIDHQFYVPAFTNPKLDSYPISRLRAGVSSLNRISDDELTEFANELRIDHQELNADALIAPGVVYEAGRLDIAQLNARLFSAAKHVGDQLNIPTYATIVLGRSVVASDQTITPVLSQATALNSDGWYFAFEFEEGRVPSARDSVRRCCTTGLTLACTGKPVLHAYAGPLGLLSLGFGATGVGIGHSQNLWKFTRDRWQPPGPQGGGGDAPPRFFSAALWGTIIYPDETRPLPAAIRTQVLTPSPFSTQVSSNLPWERWDSNKHLLYILASTLGGMATVQDPRANARAAIDRLQKAGDLHQLIQQSGIFLTDNTNVYQANWRLALEDLLRDRAGDFDYLDLLR
jgi:hypothetical protein